MNSEMIPYLHMITKGVFWILIPAVTIFFRVKKKLKTGFAVGIMLLSFAIGLLTQATIHEDPFSQFYGAINQKNEKEATKQFKILIQYGPEHLGEIDETKIVYKSLFVKIKSNLKEEYGSIAERLYNKYSVDPKAPCSELVANRKNHGNLKHAMRLIEFSESIGGTHDDLKEKLKSKTGIATQSLDVLEEKCD